jgi:ring-1,2-phenylacetyl-CoA epoxidase subunit PaaC
MEDELALANIALDLLGQARLLLTRAGQAEGSARTEDSFAYFRDAGEFRNVRLVELVNGDFAACVVRLLSFSTWRLAALRHLVGSADPIVAAVAAKGVKEVTYHRDYAAQWVVRLGDGTTYSRARVEAALSAIWAYTPELFATSEVERTLVASGVAVDPVSLADEFDDVIATVLGAATLSSPGPVAEGSVGGRVGDHTQDLDELLAELQGLARADPEATW